MFNIEEIRYLCKMNHQTFYLSPRSTYEYLIYGDIDHYKILIDEPIETWLKRQSPVDYDSYDDGICIWYRDELMEIEVCSLQGKSIETYLMEQTYNIDAISIRISTESHPDGFACYKDKFTAVWVDPCNCREKVKSGYIEILNKSSVTGDQLFEMVYMMVKQKLDIYPEFIEIYKERTYEITQNVTDMFFEILKSHHAYYYLRILDKLSLLENAYPLIKEIKKKGLWNQGLKDLQKLETIFSHYELFSDGVKRMIERDLNEVIGYDFTKYQMLKFAVLFRNAHYVMKLKHNAPERYEDNFESFCEYFRFKEELCSYYGAVIHASKKMILNIEDRIDKHKQYEFYEEYGDLTIDVLLLYFIQSEINPSIINHLEYLIRTYVTQYIELQSINSEITTLDIERHDLSDVALTLMLEDIKRRIFFGNLRYDRNHIVNYLQKLIEQS